MSFCNLPLKLAVMLVVVSIGGAAAAEEPSEFLYRVLPTLTRAGCNAGTCHGTPSGKNGFRLSLRGFDPQLDFATLTREADGRRINWMAPEKSLVLLKATAAVPHQGGRRIERGSTAYQILYDWIAAGAPDDRTNGPHLARLVISPESTVVAAPGDEAGFRVTAEFSDGTQRDVTELCRWSVTDEAVAEILPSGVARKQTRGEVTVAAEFAGALVTGTVLFDEPVPEFHWPNPTPANRIDELVFARLKRLKLEPAELSDDATFVRRVYLDATGQLPSAEETRAFLADESPGKRARLVNRLLESPEFADWWAMKWTDRLGCNQRFVGKWGAMKYHEWIRHQMAANVPHDQFVRTVITAGGPNYENPPAGFWRRMRVGGIGKMDPLLAAEEISQLFLGVRVQCARCHNHPGEKWTQDDYYGLAAFFPRVTFRDGPYVNHQYDKEVTVLTASSGEVTQPRTGKAVAPKFLGGEPPTIADGEDRRVPFAEWVTSPENPFFARAAVNRIWYHLLGRGIVEPVDDFRSSNPPSHPELLSWLTAEFVRSGFDRKHMIRLILNSRTYQSSYRRTATARDDARYFSYYRPRLLQAEQTLDAISACCDSPEAFPGLPEGTRAVELPDGEYKHPFLEAFGRPARALACECERESSANMSQALQMAGGNVLHAKLKRKDGRAARLAESSLSAGEVLDELYLTALSRFPTDEERKLLAPRLSGAAAERQKGVEDVLWALLNHREFLFQH